MDRRRIVALSGGVGGAKLALGLSRVLAASELTVIANTADDFEHLGLYIAPDLDTVMYTLAGINNAAQGWGLADESWQCMAALERLGGDSWFRLGDRDIATHLLRSQLLAQGDSLTGVTARLCRALGVEHRLLPMCDAKVDTWVMTDQGELPFQHYFVREQCRPVASGFRFAGIEQARISTAVQQAIDDMDALVVCPSNPFVSVAPILAVPGMRQALLASGKPRIVVSPIIGGQAVKGPAAKMLAELSLPVNALAVASHYRDFASHFVLDSADACYQSAIEALGLQVLVCNTLMQTLDDRITLARRVLSQVGQD